MLFGGQELERVPTVADGRCFWNALLLGTQTTAELELWKLRERNEQGQPVFVVSSVDFLCPFQTCRLRGRSCYLRTRSQDDKGFCHGLASVQRCYETHRIGRNAGMVRHGTSACLAWPFVTARRCFCLLEFGHGQRVQNCRSKRRRRCSVTLSSTLAMLRAQRASFRSRCMLRGAQQSSMRDPPSMVLATAPPTSIFCFELLHPRHGFSQTRELKP